jgi:hypothetical protein
MSTRALSDAIDAIDHYDADRLARALYGLNCTYENKQWLLDHLKQIRPSSRWAQLVMTTARTLPTVFCAPLIQTVKKILTWSSRMECDEWICCLEMWHQLLQVEPSSQAWSWLTPEMLLGSWTRDEWTRVFSVLDQLDAWFYAWECIHSWASRGIADPIDLVLAKLYRDPAHRPLNAAPLEEAIPYLYASPSPLVRETVVAWAQRFGVWSATIRFNCFLKLIEEEAPLAAMRELLEQGIDIQDDGPDSLDLLLKLDWFLHNNRDLCAAILVLVFQFTSWKPQDVPGTQYGDEMSLATLVPRHLVRRAHLLALLE